MENLVSECNARLERVQSMLEGTQWDHSQLQLIATQTFENLDSNGKEVMGVQLKHLLIEYSVSRVD
jgi:hypothetical protein